MNGFLFAFSYPNDFSMTVLELLMYPTSAATLLALFVLVINILFRKWLSAGQMGLLWGLVLLRLAMPVGPESSLSLQNLFISVEQEAAPVDVSVKQWRPRAYNSSDAALQDIFKTAALKPLPLPEISFTETLLEYLVFFLALFFELLPLIWFVGAVLIAVRMLIVHWRFVRKVNRVSACTDERLLQLWQSCCEQVRASRYIPIIVFDQISQPSVMGAMHPKLLLTSDMIELEEDQLRLIMLHELAHITRRDLCVNWALFGLRLIHWWNPIYWLAATRFHNLREQSRDAMVLRWLKKQADDNNNHDYPLEYSELLLALAQRPTVGSRWRVILPVSLLGFLKSPLCKRSLANRLKALRSATIKYHWLHQVAVIAAIFIFAASGLSDAKLPPVQEYVAPPWLSTLTFEVQPDNSNFGPLIVQTFDVSAPLKKIIKEEQSTESQARRLILLTVKNQLGLLKSSHQYSSGSLSEDSKPEAHYGEGNKLIVLAPAAWQKELGIMLDTWANSGFGRIVFETRLAAMFTDIAPIVGIEWSNLEGYVAPESHTKFESLPDSKKPIVQASASVEEYFPVRIAVLTKEQEFQFIKKAQSDERSAMSFCPMYTAFNGQKVVVENLIYRPFVIGLEKQDGKQLKPKIKTIEEGMSLTLRPIFSVDCSEVHLNGLVQLSQVVDVNTFTTEIAGKEVTIQTPRVHRRRISVASNLNAQQCLLVCIPPTFQEKRFQYVMIKVRLINEMPDFVASNPPVKPTE